MNGCSVSDSPAVLGQLLAGIILGPSVFWRNLASGPTSDLFAQFVPKMLNAVSELGVLLLLILTGMETHSALVKRMRRSAAITSAAGIVIPFACGYVLGEMLPDSVLPDANRRLLTSLFLAIGLSIFSVKIAAAVLREVDCLRRNPGQVSRDLGRHHRLDDSRVYRRLSGAGEDCNRTDAPGSARRPRRVLNSCRGRHGLWFRPTESSSRRRARLESLVLLRQQHAPVQANMPPKTVLHPSTRCARARSLRHSSRGYGRCAQNWRCLPSRWGSSLAQSPMHQRRWCEGRCLEHGVNC
jgi:Sodium/hydrogen exchanger family